MKEFRSFSLVKIKNEVHATQCDLNANINNWPINIKIKFAFELH